MENKSKKILLLGDRGKLGNAIKKVMSDYFKIVGKNSSNFDAYDFNSFENIINEEKPDIVINTVALLGIDPCELEPGRAFSLNSLMPKTLAELSVKYNYVFVHFSTDAVFNDSKGDFYTEEDIPYPLNVYGSTKYAGDCLIKAIAKKYYIFRIPVLFGYTEKQSQFVEKMLKKIEDGTNLLRISGDIISSPTYSIDIAFKLMTFLKENKGFGLYHIANEGQASLFEVMKSIVEYLGINVVVERISYLDFPFIGIKNTFTPLKSIKTTSLRPWREALNDYCTEIIKVKKNK